MSKAATTGALMAAIALLAACDTKSPAPSSQETTIAVDGKEVTVDATPTAEPASGGEAPTSLDPQGDGGETPAPEPTLINPHRVPANDVADDSAPLTAIPARFLGQWDGIEGSCTPDSDLFLTIRPGTITFYESQGEVAAVRRGKPGIVVTLAMQGEGESWTADYAMSLAKGGNQLATRELSETGAGTLRRRCQADRSTPGS